MNTTILSLLFKQQLSSKAKKNKKGKKIKKIKKSK